MVRSNEASKEATFLTRQSRINSNGFCFTVVDDGVVVGWQQNPDKLQFRHSFSDAQLLNRVRQPGQALIKACSNKQRSIKSLLDLTGGWGVDSFILAHHGLNVTMLEQNELVYHIAAHSLNCARPIKSISETANRIELIHTSSLDFLLKLEHSTNFDCIYLDPMFPDHKSTAKPAKELQILQHLTENMNIDECFTLALQKSKNRVVVKRPAKSAPISDLTPVLVYNEKTIRFDVYLTRNNVVSNLPRSSFRP
jgi:16S rRNA (guanine1516-N2)-methyltransferase